MKLKKTLNVVQAVSGFSAGLLFLFFEVTHTSEEVCKVVQDIVVSSPGSTAVMITLATAYMVVSFGSKIRDALKMET